MKKKKLSLKQLEEKGTQLPVKDEKKVKGGDQKSFLAGGFCIAIKKKGCRKVFFGNPLLVVKSFLKCYYHKLIPYPFRIIAN